MNALTAAATQRAVRHERRISKCAMNWILFVAVVPPIVVLLWSIGR